MPAPARNFGQLNTIQTLLAVTSLSPRPWRLSEDETRLYDAQNNPVATLDTNGHFHDFYFLRDSPGYVQSLADQVNNLEQYVSSLLAYIAQTEATDSSD